MSRQKLIVGYAEGIYVCSGIYLRVGDVAQYLLGCGILWRPDETVARIFIAAVHPCYSQIHQFDHTAILEHDVGWLDVAMYHSARVQICEGVKHTAYLVAYLLDTVFGRKVAELRTHMLVECKAGDIIAEDEDRSRVGILLTHTYHPDDVGMRERERGFLPRPLPDKWFVGISSPDAFDGNALVRVAVVAEEHNSHGPFAQRLG